MQKTKFLRLASCLPALSVIGLTVAGCKPKEEAAAPPAMMMAPVTAVSATVRDVPIYLDEIGKAVASQSVIIVPQVSGAIMARHFEDGADLKKGQLLFEIDPRPFQAQLDQAKGQLAKDLAQKTSSEWNVQQDQAAMESKAISEQQLHNDIGSRDAAIGAIAVDQAEIETAQLNLNYCKITSPIDGRAGQRLVDVGNVVTAAGQAAGTNLLSIQTLDPIYADFTITEAELLKVQQYMLGGKLKVMVQLPTDVIAAAGVQPATQPTALPPGAGSDTPHPAAIGLPTAQQTGSAVTEAMAGPATQPAALPIPRAGELTFLDNAVQDGSGTVKLRATLPNGDHHFWPGQFVNARLILKVQKDAVLVPSQAVQISQMGPFVYVVDATGAAQAHPVEQGQRQGDMVVIEKGISPGDSVIVTGQMLVQPGGKVMVVNAPHPPGGVPAAAQAGNKTASSSSTASGSEGMAS